MKLLMRCSVAQLKTTAMISIFTSVYFRCWFFEKYQWKISLVQNRSYTFLWKDFYHDFVKEIWWLNFSRVEEIFQRNGPRKNIDMVWCFNFQYSWEMNSKCCNIRVQVVDRFSVVGGWNVENISLFRHLYKDRCLNDQIWSYNLLWLHTLVVYHGKAHIKSFWGLTS